LTDLREERRQELLRESGGQTMVQEAPWPEILEELVDRLYYKPGWTFQLSNINRGQGSTGLTLVITTATPDSYHPEKNIRVTHYMLVPPASYDRRSWCWWLFGQVLLVEQHEAMEFFALRDDSLPELQDRCTCGHPAVAHDGRDSSCDGCLPADQHRFKAQEPRFTRPYAPAHGPGNDPYMVLQHGTDLDRRTSFTGQVNP